MLSMRTATLATVISFKLASGSSTTGSSPTTDAASEVAVDVSVPDRPSQSDATPPTDRPTAPDVSQPSLEGVWRVLRYEFPEMGSGRSVTVTDRDTMYTDPTTGTTTAVRVNGMMFIEGVRLALSFGSLANGHFYAYTPTMSALDTGYTATGFSVPGLFDASRDEFQVTGGTTTVRFERNPDGTIAFPGEDRRTRTIFTRATNTGPAMTAINTTGFAMARDTTGPGTRNTRVAVLWDLQGPRRWLETNGAAVRLAGRFATYPFVLAATPPMGSVVPWRDSQVAVGRVVIYDDVDRDQRFAATGDVLLGVSPVAVVWRAQTPFTKTGVAHFALRHMEAGWRYGHVRLDLSIGQNDVVPYDGSEPVAPDVPVSSSSVGDVPEIL
jgi:hypothetical protein